MSSKTYLVSVGSVVKHSHILKNVRMFSLNG